MTPGCPEERGIKAPGADLRISTLHTPLRKNSLPLAQADCRQRRIWGGTRPTPNSIRQGLGQYYGRPNEVRTREVFPWSWPKTGVPLILSQVLHRYPLYLRSRGLSDKQWTRQRGGLLGPNRKRPLMPCRRISIGLGSIGAG